MSRRFKVIAIIAFSLAALTVIGLLLLPEVVRRTAIARLEDQWGTRVTIGDLDLNVFTGNISVTDLAVFKPNEENLGLKIPKAELRLSFLSLLRRQDVLTIGIDIGSARISLPGMKQPAFSVSLISAPKVQIDFPNNRVRIGTLTLTQPSLRIEREPTGQWNLEKFFGGTTQTPDSAVHPIADQPGLIPINAEIDSVSIRSGTLELVDSLVTPVVTTVIRGLRLNLEDLTAEGKTPISVKGNGQIDEGSVEIAGRLLLQPFSTNLTLTAKSIPLRVFKGYIDGTIEPLSLREGNAHGVLEFTSGVQGETKGNLELSGKAEFDDLTLGAEGIPKPVFIAEKLKIDIRKIQTNPSFTVDINRTDVQKAILRIQREEDGKIPLAPLLLSPAEPDTGKKSPDQTSDGTATRIRALRIVDSQIDYIDQSINPMFKTSVSKINMEMGDQKGEKTPVKIEGLLNETAPLKISGTVQLSQKPLRLDLEGTLSDYDLSAIAPYAVKHIDYEIERGRITMAMKYNYDQNELDAENQIEIRRLSLGKKHGSKFDEQVGIPLKLAIALLADVNGQIRLSIPVKVNFQETTYRMEAFWTIVRNSLIKLLIAPFGVLGKIVTFGGKIEEIRIDPIVFPPGSEELTPESKQQLRELADFMKQRPGIELQIRGYALENDRKELRLRLAREQIKLQPGGETYEQALSRVYRSSGGEISADTPPSPQSMEEFLAELVTMPEDTLQKLAEQRSRQVVSSLTDLGVEPKRLFVSPSGEKEPEKMDAGRVEFSLLY